MSYQPYPTTVNASTNSTTTPLSAGGVFTGEWVDARQYNSVVISTKTDQDGTASIQFSPDGVNVDSTLTKYYRTSRINPPHRYTITRDWVRVIFTNTSTSDQTYLRLQTTFGDKADLNAPLDAVLAQNYDATPTRPSNYKSEVALGRRQGETLWNKFGYNSDLDTGTEVIASWGGTFTPLTTATTLTVVSTSTADDDGGTGCNSIVVYGIDENRDEQIELITMNGTTNVVTTSTWLGINRVVMFLCGSGQVNAGTINITATTGGSQMAQMPVGGGVTQQCIFHIPRNHQFIMEWLTINVLNRAKNAELTFRVWVYSAISNGKQEVFREDIDTAVTNDVMEVPPLPFPISGSTVIWVEGTSNTNDISVNSRFSGILVRDISA